MTLLEDARAMAGDLADLRHRLHRRPEIGLKLQQTQATVLEALAGMDLEIHTGNELGSVTAVVRGSAPRAGEAESVVLLRADMDALPVHEEVDVPFRSTVDGA